MRPNAAVGTRPSARAGSPPQDIAKGLEMAERITFELNGDADHRGRAGYAVALRGAQRTSARPWHRRRQTCRRMHWRSRTMNGIVRRFVESYDCCGRSSATALGKGG